MIWRCSVKRETEREIEKKERGRGGEETKPTPKPQEAALTNGAVPQPTSAVLRYGPFFAVIYQHGSERIVAGAFD